MKKSLFLVIVFLSLMFFVPSQTLASENNTNVCTLENLHQCSWGDLLKLIIQIISGKNNVAPVACNDIYSPVCGVDNKTYSNSCYAKKAKVVTSYEGECEEKPLEELKTYPNSCSLSQGECRSCIDLYSPVCGLDNKTYSNSCYADVAGVGIKHDGECK